MRVPSPAAPFSSPGSLGKRGSPTRRRSLSARAWSLSSFVESAGGCRAGWRELDLAGPSGRPLAAAASTSSPWGRDRPFAPTTRWPPRGRADEAAPPRVAATSPHLEREARDDPSRSGRPPRARRNVVTDASTQRTLSAPSLAHGQQARAFTASSFRPSNGTGRQRSVSSPIERARREVIVSMETQCLRSDGSPDAGLSPAALRND